jgi:hypothetical protein
MSISRIQHIAFSQGRISSSPLHLWEGLGEGDLSRSSDEGGQIDKNPYKKTGTPVKIPWIRKNFVTTGKTQSLSPLSLILSRQGRGNNKQGKANHHLFSNYDTACARE